VPGSVQSAVLVLPVSALGWLVRGPCQDCSLRLPGVVVSVRSVSERWARQHDRPRLGDPGLSWSMAHSGECGAHPRV